MHPLLEGVQKSIAGIVNSVQKLTSKVLVLLKLKELYPLLEGVQKSIAAH
jgi:hypothetical protein